SLRNDAQVLPRVQSARRARRDLGHRARRLHRPRARPRPRRRPGLLRVARAARLPDGEEVSEATLLVELLTEELPPKSLARLGEVFSDEVFNGLVQHQLKLRDFTGWRFFSTPRRLAVLIPKVSAAGQDRVNEVTGPSANAPAAAIAGFAKKHGIDVGELEH